MKQVVAPLNRRYEIMIEPRCTQGLAITFLVSLLVLKAPVFFAQNAVEFAYETQKPVAILFYRDKRAKLENPVAVGPIHSEAQYYNLYRLRYVRCRTVRKKSTKGGLVVEGVPAAARNKRMPITLGAN